MGDNVHYVLWGSHPRYAEGVPIKLEIGSRTDCVREQRYRQTLGGWTSLEIKRSEA